MPAQLWSHPTATPSACRVLTTSHEEKEILKMYELRCSSYIVKLVDFQKFVRVIQTFNDYWLSVVILSPKQP